MYIKKGIISKAGHSKHKTTSIHLVCLSHDVLYMPIEILALRYN